MERGNWNDDAMFVGIFEELDIDLSQVYEPTIQEHVLTLASKCDDCLRSSTQVQQRVNILMAHFNRPPNIHGSWCNEINVEFDDSQGDDSQGDDSQGDDSQGDDSQGDDSQGDDSQGDDSQGDE
jgi:hypothetical protein